MSAHTGPWLAPRWSTIPPELQALQRWVVWRIARGTKVPFDPNHPSAHASVTRPETWGTYDEARALVQAREGEPDAFEGVGVVLDGDGLAGVDLDDCAEHGQPSAQAWRLLQELGPGYMEWSPSGRGIRVFGRATPLPKGLRGRLDGVNVELYSTGRYLTVTGHVLRDESVGPLSGFSALAQRLQAAAAAPRLLR
jgi:primase-polymerase (primpol)-like protein